MKSEEKEDRGRIDISEEDLRKFEKALYERGLNVAPRSRGPAIDVVALEVASEIEGLNLSNPTQRKARIQNVVAQAIRRFQS